MLGVLCTLAPCQGQARILPLWIGAHFRTPPVRRDRVWKLARAFALARAAWIDGFAPGFGVGSRPDRHLRVDQ